MRLKFRLKNKNKNEFLLFPQLSKCLFFNPHELDMKHGCLRVYFRAFYLAIASKTQGLVVFRVKRMQSFEICV